MVSTLHSSLKWSVQFWSSFEPTSPSISCFEAMATLLYRHKTNDYHTTRVWLKWDYYTNYGSQIDTSRSTIHFIRHVCSGYYYVTIRTEWKLLQLLLDSWLVGILVELEKVCVCRKEKLHLVLLFPFTSSISAPNFCMSWFGTKEKGVCTDSE